MKLQGKPQQKPDTMKTEGKTLEQMLKTGIAQLTVLEGNAPAQHNPEAVTISGTITAPSIFVSKRDVDPKTAHCLVSITEGKMKLVVNEQDTVNKFTITGTITVGKKLTEIGINSGKEYTGIELASKLRMLRSLFVTREDHMKLTNQLRNLKAKIQQDIEASKDDKGNAKVSFEQTVESNMPDSFKMKIPLIEGEVATVIEVQVILSVQGQGVMCNLESVDAQEIIDTIKEKLIGEEVKKIEDKVTVIYY